MDYLKIFERRNKTKVSNKKTIQFEGEYKYNNKLSKKQNLKAERRYNNMKKIVIVIPEEEDGEIPV